MADKKYDLELGDSESEYEFSILDDSDDEDLVNDLVSDSEDDLCFDSEDDIPLSDRTNEWVPYTADDLKFRKFNFTVPNPGFQIPINERPADELGYFQLFFTDEILQEITDATNLYAKVKIVRPLQQFSIWHTWVDVSLTEMKAFIGVILNMGLHHKPELVDYFSDDWLTKMPFFKDVFPKARFLQIFWMLHLPADTDTEEKPGWKTRHLCEYIDRKCREHFVPKKNICIDESTVGFKGRVAFICYNPKKPTKWGMRVYCLCDSETGYVCCHVVYYGQTTTDGLILPEQPFTSRIVLHLTDMLLKSVHGSGYHLFTDRFYTSPHLAMELHGLNTHITGTVLTNRKDFPGQLKKPKLDQYEVKAFQKRGKMMALSFFDKRIVSMISTYHNPATETVTRTKKKGVSETYAKPTVIIEYTKYMGGVDRADHYCGSYNFTRKTLKWWRKLFFWILEVAIVNSYHLHSIDKKERNTSPLSHLKFRNKLIKQLVANTRNVSLKRGRPANDDEQRLDGKSHFIMQKVNKSTKDCVVCSDRKTPGGRRETSFYCETCTRQPGLHPGACFKRYHTERSYK